MESIAKRRVEDAWVPEMFCVPGRRHIGTGTTDPEAPGRNVSELSQPMDACGANNYRKLTAQARQATTPTIWACLCL